MVWRATPIDFGKDIDPGTLNGKSILITGGTEGIGYDIARVAARHGAYVTITARNKERGLRRQNELVSDGLKAQFIEADVSDWNSQLGAFKAAVAFSPTARVDVVIVNAGLYGSAPFADLLNATDTEDPAPPSTAVLDVNLKGAYYTTALALHFFKKTGQPGDSVKKQLLFIGSIAGYLTQSLLTDYAASKYGVRAIWKSLRFQDEALGFGFRTNLVAPGFIDTPLVTPQMTQELQKMGCPIGTVDEVTAAVVRLLVDESIDGRAVAVAKGAIWDLEDDLAGGDAAKTLHNPEALYKLGGPAGKLIVSYNDYFDD
ncbi:5'-hydroxyaverantin dehydrogenase-like protein 3 [Elsinoe australis]|uniref:5'-hydroxyaverantin dehydrogenase-like protein 3 n=1 Tax=Elsinoe australis TaxID=40998 RepID=A0A4U7AW14_9PEZI|nr:5'-hydroxyaverantin dehydrogenase-like protein 3 [Elsinoe australis]